MGLLGKVECWRLRSALLHLQVGLLVGAGRGEEGTVYRSYT